MISWTKGIVAVLALGATGMGCELILKADRSRIGATTGAADDANLCVDVRWFCGFNST